MVRLIYPPRCELDHDWQAQHPRRDRGGGQSLGPSACGTDGEPNNPHPQFRGRGKQ